MKSNLKKINLLLSFVCLTVISSSAQTKFRICREANTGAKFYDYTFFGDKADTIVSWSGSSSKNLINGKGKLTLTTKSKSGFVYEGTVKNGCITGNGKYIVYTSEGEIDRIEEGSFLNGKLHGDGKWTMKLIDNFRIQEGKFINGDLEGDGKEYCPEYKYTGNYHEGNFEGYGIMECLVESYYNSMAAGERYIGYFKEGKFDGDGEYYYPNGVSIKAAWKNGGTIGNVKLIYKGIILDESKAMGEMDLGFHRNISSTKLDAYLNEINSNKQGAITMDPQAARLLAVFVKYAPKVGSYLWENAKKMIDNVHFTDDNNNYSSSSNSSTNTDYSIQLNNNAYAVVTKYEEFNSGGNISIENDLGSCISSDNYTSFVFDKNGKIIHEIIDPTKDNGLYGLHFNLYDLPIKVVVHYKCYSENKEVILKINNSGFYSLKLSR